MLVDHDTGVVSGHGVDSATITRTGPSRPEGYNSADWVYLVMLVRVRRCSLGKNVSPISRFGHSFTTSISSSFAPVLKCLQ